MDNTLIAIIFLTGLALFFDFLNGFHDAANSIATIVATRVLSPRYAVIWAAFFNFIAFAFFGLHVAGTIGKGIRGQYRRGMNARLVLNKVNVTVEVAKIHA